MARESLRILHIGNEMSWRGGENQVRLLIEGARMKYSEIPTQHFVAYPLKSRGFRKFAEIADVLPLPSKSSLDPRNVWVIEKFCKEKNIHILDAQSSVGFTWALAVKKRLPYLKLVVHRRVDNVIKKNFITRRKYLSPQVDVFVAISGAIRNILIDYGISSEKTHLIRSAVDEAPYLNLDRGEGRERLKEICAHNSAQPVITENTVFIGNASALTAQKGHDILLKACAELAHAKLDFHCFIAGGGDDTDKLHNMLRALDIRDHVTMLGHVHDVPEFLCGLDVLVVPSRNEGLGTILLEGVYASCALVGTNVGGIPEIIHNDHTGLLVPSEDVGALTAALTRLIGHRGGKELEKARALREKLSTEAREFARKEFSLEAMVNGNLEIYKKLYVSASPASDGI